MENKKTVRLGFLGFGAMGSALAEGLARFCPAVKKGELLLSAYAPHADKLKKRAEPLGVEVRASAEELAQSTDMLLLAVKPDQTESALKGISASLDGKAVISVVNAWDLSMLRELLGDGVRVQCAMPNTPVAVGSGTVILADEHSLRADEREEIEEWFSCLGAVVSLPGAKMRAASAISGCGPAFLYMVIEALGDAGVKNGLKRQDAYRLAAATLVGAGRMVLEGRGHPGELKDAVCSPGGTTIRGVAALEEAGMRAAFIRAVDAAGK